jgi:hypothetical protein
MKPEIKKQWVAALNSGAYKQTINYLKDDTGFCCLGVLCDLYLKEHNEKWEERESYNGTKYFIDDYEDEQLPRPVQRWAGLGQGVPDVCLDGDYRSLAELNDEGNYDFKQIAQIIEEHL